MLIDCFHVSNHQLINIPFFRLFCRYLIFAQANVRLRLVLWNSIKAKLFVEAAEFVYENNFLVDKEFYLTEAKPVCSFKPCRQHKEDKEFFLAGPSIEPEKIRFIFV